MAGTTRAAARHCGSRPTRNGKHGESRRARGTCWHTRVAPELKARKQLFVVAYTSSIRGLARVIEGLNDQEAADFRIATAISLVYLLGNDLKIIRRADLNDGMVNNLRY